MSKAKIFHFNNLPAGVRDRFVACTKGQGSPVPIVTEPMRMTKPIVGGISIAVCALIGLAVVWNYGYGKVYEDTAIYGVGGLIAIAMMIVGVVAPIGWIAKRKILRSRLPYEPGLYLLGGDLIDARTDVLRVEAVLATRPEIIHHHYNGSYTGTSVTFRGEGSVYRFMIKNRMQAEQKLAALRGQLAAMGQAIENQDMAAIQAIDPFFAVRITDTWERMGATPPTAPPTDGIHSQPLPVAGKYAMAIAAVAGLVASPVAWTLRNRGSDDEMFETSGSVWSLKAYLEHGGRHTGEAKKRLYEVALEEAKRENTVTALRKYLDEYPDAPEALKTNAKEEIHTRFTAALEEFRGQAAGRDPRAIKFVETLLAYQEQAMSPPLEVRFRPPTTDSLEPIDKMLAAVAADAKGKYDFAPLAPNFDEATAVPREQTIESSLADGFTQVFPHDMLELVQGARLADKEELPADKAVVEVEYEVAPMREDDGTPSIYVRDSTPGEFDIPDINKPKDELQGRLYVGIEVFFVVTMRVPGADPYKLTMSVRPPERFDIGNGAGDSDIYRIMADRAFDNLKTNLTGAFFAGGDGAAPPAPAGDDEDEE